MSDGWVNHSPKDNAEVIVIRFDPRFDEWLVQACWNVKAGVRWGEWAQHSWKWFARLEDAIACAKADFPGVPHEVDHDSGKVNVESYFDGLP